MMIEPVKKDDLITLFKDVPYGTHFCLFYATGGDLSKVLIPFLSDGLKHNDAFIYVESKNRSFMEDLLIKGFHALGVSFRKGQIEIIPDGELYYSQNIANPDMAMAEWIGRYNQAIANGFSGLRIIGSPYQEAKNLWHDLIHWENYVNKDISKYKLILFCHYPIDCISAADVPTLLGSHQFSMFSIDGDLKFFEGMEVRQLREALHESEEKFSILTESSQAGILVIQDEKIIYANPAVQSFTGYPKDKLLSMKFPDIIICPKQDAGASRSEAVIKTKDREERYADCSYTPILFNGKQAMLVTMLDITGRRRAEKEVAEAKDHAELYVDLMSHDITNLNQIAIGFLELALDTLDTTGKLEEDEREYLEKPVQTIQRSSLLIHNIKKLQQERSGEYQPSIIDVAAILRDIVSQYSHVPGRDVVLNYTMAAGCRVRANELLRDVFANLVDNAVKHTTGPLVINIIQTNVTLGQKAYCKIAVEDNGHGIPDELKQKLFDRACSSRAEVQRTGFGLCLVSMLVKDFNGKLWVEDRVAGDYTQGARFVVLLPVSAPESGTPVEQAQS